MEIWPFPKKNLPFRHLDAFQSGIRPNQGSIYSIFIQLLY